MTGKARVVLWSGVCAAGVVVAVLSCRSGITDYLCVLVTGRPWLATDWGVSSVSQDYGGWNCVIEDERGTFSGDGSVRLLWRRGEGYAEVLVTNGRVIPVVVVVATIAIAMGVALRRTAVPRAIRVATVVGGALVGAVPLGLSTTTRTVMPTLEHVTVLERWSPVRLAIGGVVGGLVGYAGASAVYAWVWRRREHAALNEQRPTE